MTENLPEHLAIALDLIAEWRANEHQPNTCLPSHSYVLSEWDPEYVVVALLTAVSGFCHYLEAISPGSADHVLGTLTTLYATKFPTERITP